MSGAPEAAPLLVGDRNDAYGATNEERAKKKLSFLRWFNVLTMGAGFLLLFSGYNTAQSFSATATAAAGLGSALGLQLLSVLYGSCVLTLPFCPVAVHWLGPRAAMVLGSALYAGFIVCLSLLPFQGGKGSQASSEADSEVSASLFRGLLFLSSALVGVGAALLWTAQGQFLTRCAGAGDRGTKPGVFWALFQASGLLGNGVATALVDAGLGFRFLFMVLAGFAVLGVVVLLLLRRLPTEEVLDDDAPSGLVNETSIATAALAERGESAKTDTISPVDLTLSCLRLMSDRRILLLAPMFFFTGFELSFFSGAFPLILGAKDVAPAMLAFAGGEIVSSFSMGRLSDRVRNGRSLGVFVGLAVYAVALILCWELKVTAKQTISFGVMMYTAAALLGAADAAWNTMLYATLGTHFGKEAGASAERTTAAFTLFQIWQNIGSAVGFYYSPYVPVHGSSGAPTQLIVLSAIGLISAISFALLRT
jgi:MFS transporter, NAG-T family, sugar:H+ symporter